MVFTNPEFCSLIQRMAKRFGVQDIDFKVCRLPHGKQELLDKTPTEAIREQKAAQ